jgi:hypothetical protein
MGIDKLSLYEKRLLDLGKRNRLLNFHYYRLGALELLCPSAPSLYNKLVSSSSSIKIIDVVAKDDGSLPNRDELLAKYANKLTSNQVLLYRSDFPSRPIVRSLSHKAASSLEEKGTNILYFAFAFLSYKDPETKELLKAPLLLVPVLLEGGGPAQPYFLHASEDEAELNPTFAYYCKSVYKLDLPAFTPEVDYESYLKSIADLVAPLGWSLDSSSAALSTFSFQKMSMYLDLKNNHETIIANPVVNRLLRWSASCPRSQVMANPLTKWRSITSAWPIAANFTRLKWRKMAYRSCFKARPEQANPKPSPTSSPSRSTKGKRFSSSRRNSPLCKSSMATSRKWVSSPIASSSIAIRRIRNGSSLI